MVKFIIEIAITIWTTSTIFMLFFWAKSFITIFRQSGKFFFMPLTTFLYIHFCPIVHTVKCFKIMRRIIKLKTQAMKRGM